jgi:hypothetical protein
MPDITMALRSTMADKPRTEPIGWSPGEAVTSQCGTCLHKRAGFFCDAFPSGNGIPDEILMNQVDHKKAVPGDHGIRYEKAGNEAEA